MTTGRPERGRDEPGTEPDEQRPSCAAASFGACRAACTCSGSRSGARRNLMTLNWAMQVAMEPKLVAVSVQSTAVTHELVSESGVFALSILKRDDRALVRKFVKPVEASDVDVDASGSGTMRQVGVRSDVTGAPVLADAAAWLDCRVTTAQPWAATPFSWGRSSGSASRKRARGSPVLRMEDTRMNYGG